MGRHGSRGAAKRWLPVALAVVAVSAVTLVALRPWDRADVARQSPDAGPAPAPSCPRVLHVATASSFTPVLAALAPKLATGEDCLGLTVSMVDGRPAAGQLAELQADVWIPDDAAWASTAEEKLLARPGVAHSGTVIATSPIYLVADQATARQLRKSSGGSWSGLAGLLLNRGGVRLAVRDPAGSGDGLVAAGSLAEAVWLQKGMDASSLAMIDMLPKARTVTDDRPALPARAGEVGLVPEYALLSGRPREDLATLAPGDHTALLRFTWLPTSFGYVRPDGAAALERLFAALTAPENATLVRAARLRRPDARQPPPEADDRMPPVRAQPFEVMGGHKVEHVFAAWYPQDRTTNLLLAVDVSLSMTAKPEGAPKRLIDLVRDGCRSVGDLLPDEARLGLWEFGSRLDGPRDHRVLLPLAPLGDAHRRRLSSAIGALDARDTGTGLYDTILAAYRSAVAGYRPGVLNQVLVFTDGKNEYDSPTINARQLAAQLRQAADPKRPVELTIAAFGSAPQIEELEKAVAAVDSYVEHVDEAEEVAATFVHVAAGGGGH